MSTVVVRGDPGDGKLADGEQDQQPGTIMVLTSGCPLLRPGGPGPPVIS
jgi:hypothetical protein